MWYLLSLGGTVLLVVGLAAPGTLVIDACLPFRQRPIARRFFSPLIGLALLVCPATLLGWFGGGFHWWICLPLTLGLVAAGPWRRIVTAPGAVRHGLTLAAFCVLASFPFLGQLVVCKAFDPFNDAFFYLVQGQWLQGHGFAEPVHPDGFHPAWAQVSTFQETRLRMGPSFLLGWWQAAGGLPWSYQVYPLLSALMLVAGGLAVGGAVLTARPGWRRAAWLAALIAAASRNGFGTAPNSGFLPQVCGLAFAAGTLGLRGLEMQSPSMVVPGSVLERLRAGFPLALLAAAVVFCYPEVFPFMATAWVASHVLHPALPRRRTDWSLRFARVWPTAALVLVLVNFEWFRFWQALQIQAHVLSGFPVAWHPWEFAAHAVGLRAPPATTTHWLWNARWFFLLAMLPFAAGFISLVRSREGTARRLSPRPQTLLSAALMVACLAAAFLWFRYGVANPWPQGEGIHPPGIGQSWSEFKLSEWASLAAVALTIAGFLILAGRRRLASTGLLLLWGVAELAWSAGGLTHPTRAFRAALGVNTDPFATLLTLRQVLASVPKDDVVYLDFQGDDFKSRKIRELPVYFLSDRRLAGDWTADSGLLWNLLPENERNMPITRAGWMVRAPHDADGRVRFTVERLGVSPDRPAAQR